MERTLTPARLAALALIALAAIGLAYAKFGAGARHVTVPQGARAGQLTLHPCHYRGFAADCGTLVVPEHRSNPRSRLIALPVKRIRARTPHPGTPVFRLEGGPGQTNFNFPAASWIVPDHDLVLVGYRGVEGSSRLDCPEVTAALAHSADLIAPQSMHAYARAYGDCARRLQGTGVDLGGYSLSERVDDMEAARTALGYPRIDLISESAGTRTALIYAWRHPRSIERSVMVGANPPGRFLWDPATTDAQIARYARLCAADRYCRSRTPDLEATMRTAIPRRWGPFPIESGNVRLATFFGLTESTKAANPLASPTTFDTWLAGEDGDHSGFWFQSLMARLTLPSSDVWGDAASVAQADRAAAERHFAGRRPSILGDPFSQFLWGGGEVLKYWPANHDDDQYARMRPTSVPTLVISGTNDFATPPRFATRELLPYLRHGHQVLVGELGHTTDFWHHDQKAGARLVDTFLDTGKVVGYPHRAMDFHPPVRQTTLAKRIAGLLVGLAVLAVASVAWLLRRRRPFGRVASALLRSVHAVLIGLGGWALVALATMILAPAFPLDDGVLATLAAGLPVGLAVARVSRTPLPVALSGALLGGSLSVTAGPPAIVTVAIGAVAGANLAVIGFELLAARRPARIG